VSFKLNQSSFALEPRYSPVGISSSGVDISGLVCSQVNGDSICSLRTQQGAVRDISVNGIRLWRPVCPELRASGYYCVDETGIHF
jgi:hypothetical protein